MTSSSQTPAEIQRLSYLFLPFCDDRATLLALATMATDQNRWSEGHDLFQKIRLKTLAAVRANDQLKLCQYYFEEVCAKTLYNLSGFPAPFDKDAIDWIHPNAATFAQALGISSTAQ